MVYIADVLGYGLVVYSSEIDRAWRFEKMQMNGNPDWSTFTIDNTTFNLMDGIFGLALSPKGIFIHFLALELNKKLCNCTLQPNSITKSSALLPCAC